MTTETGAGQWGTALSMACAYLGPGLQRLHGEMHLMSRKPFPARGDENLRCFRYPSAVHETTEVGKKIFLPSIPGTTGSLGCAISEAVEAADDKGGISAMFWAASFLRFCFTRAVIGLETKAAMDKYGYQARHHHRMCRRRLQPGRA